MARQVVGGTGFMRSFGASMLLTVVGADTVLAFLGPSAAAVTLVLVAIEIAFSFDNAIVNAKVLGTLSPFWRRMFLTLGMVIAVLGMRVLFPIGIVAVTAHLPWPQVLQLALHQPQQYAKHLAAAHTSIASFGGAFLLLLALDFFLDEKRQVLWLVRVEKFFQSITRIWLPVVLALAAVGVAALWPGNHEAGKTFGAGAAGIATYLVVQLITTLFGATQRPSRTRTGWAALVTFIYLEVLDASFSFDGVLGAFAVTSKVVLIAIGLGIGALWVRSFTLFMVQRGTLQRYKYIEHGAHYTILLLSLLLLVSVVVEVPEAIAGVAGLGCIGASFAASKRELRRISRQQKQR